jgi:hypothetical protein
MCFVCLNSLAREYDTVVIFVESICFDVISLLCYKLGIGNFSVQYNFTSISVALIIMSASLCTLDDDSCRDGTQAVWVHSTATATVFTGAILGQLTVFSIFIITCQDLLIANANELLIF